MSDIYVQYEYKDAVSGSVQHIFAKVPSAKIHEYRQANDDQTKSEEDIAKILSDGPAAKRLGQLRGYWINVSCSDALPAKIQERAPAFEENGMTFWTIKE